MVVSIIENYVSPKRGIAGIFINKRREYKANIKRIEIVKS